MKKIPLSKIEFGDVDLETYNKSESYIHVYKCMKSECRLEFIVFSWQEDWSENHKSFCPECGGRESMKLFTRFVNRKIWEIVSDPDLGQEKSIN